MERLQKLQLFESKQPIEGSLKDFHLGSKVIVSAGQTWFVYYLHE